MLLYAALAIRRLLERGEKHPANFQPFLHIPVHRGSKREILSGSQTKDTTTRARQLGKKIKTIEL